MKSWKLITLPAAALAFCSCTATRTARVDAGPGPGPVFFRLPEINKGPYLPPQHQMTAVNHALSGGLTPEEQGRKYFPGLKGEDAATVEIQGMYTRTVLQDGSTVPCVAPTATIRAKASKAELQEVINRLQADLYQRGRKQGKVITDDEIGFAKGDNAMAQTPPGD